MEPAKLKVERILDISKAIDLIGGIDDLPQKESYWLGRVGDSTESVKKNYLKSREKLQKKIQKLQKPLYDSYEKIENKQSKEATDILEEINKLNEQFAEEHDVILSQEEEIKMPEKFKLEAFAATEDITRALSANGKTTEIKIKKGQTLVPIQFYKLMGDLITE